MMTNPKEKKEYLDNLTKKFVAPAKDEVVNINVGDKKNGKN